MSATTLASVIVNNYNYGRYVGEAIESALAQSHGPTEVIVVDDGSTDESRRVIEGYAGRARVVLKENGGQASALNAGFRVSRGEVVVFLDSDDVLLPTAVERAAALLADPGVAKVHWPMWEVDRTGAKTGRIVARGSRPYPIPHRPRV
jgi:glycosyltransferase involved in cell wall biosynthesis